jgi:hypothetical protein
MPCNTCASPCNTCGTPCNTCCNTGYAARRRNRGACNTCCAPCATCGGVVMAGGPMPPVAGVTPAGAAAPAPMAPAPAVPVMASPCGGCGGCAVAAPCCETGGRRHRLFGRRRGGNECCNTCCN